MSGTNEYSVASPISIASANPHSDSHEEVAATTASVQITPSIPAQAPAPADDGASDVIEADVSTPVSWTIVNSVVQGYRCPRSRLGFWRQ